MASNRPSKLGVPFYFICRHTVPTSIQSSNYLPNSKPCCGRSLHIPSRTPPSPSTACVRPSPLACAKSLGLNAQHSSPIQDMVNLIGKRSNWLKFAITVQGGLVAGLGFVLSDVETYRILGVWTYPDLVDG